MEISNPRETRHKMGINQEEFWRRIGVTQSAGSRYENGRAMTRPTRELYRLVHVEKLDLAKVNSVDIAIAAHLREVCPELYETLGKVVKGVPGQAITLGR